jgi:hypothetical protein
VQFSFRTGSHTSSFACGLRGMGSVGEVRIDAGLIQKLNPGLVTILLFEDDLEDASVDDQLSTLEARRVRAV